MPNSYYWKVFKSIAKRIKTTQDLNDFYAYMDDLSESIITYRTQEEYVDRLPTFLFYSPELPRIEKLCDAMLYTPGEYDENNAKRILGIYFKHEYRLLFNQNGENIRRLELCQKN